MTVIYDDKGYVIRCVELQDTGRVYYRGKETYVMTSYQCV